MPANVFDLQKRAVQARIEAMLEAASAWHALAEAHSEVPVTLLETRERLQETLASLSDGLITIGFVGPFSSGKTLLISSLLNQVRADIDEDDGNWTWDTKLLPTDTAPTTSKPVEVRHAPRPAFYVRYEGRSDHVQLPPLKEIIAAHVASSTDPADDFSQNVESAILETPDMPIPGKFLDLPGTQSTRTADDMTVFQNLERADCFVFVSSAARTLDGQAVKQLDDLYQIFLSEGKPVFFALTQIDTRMNKQSGKYAWQQSQEINNRTLSELFLDPVTNKPNEVFIGVGFVPVSAVSAAKANYLGWKGYSDKRVDAEMRFGNPAILIRHLSSFFYETVAPRRLDNILGDAKLLCRSMEREMTMVTTTLATPLAELESVITDGRDFIAAVMRERKAIESSVSQIFADLAKEVSTGPVRDDLRAALGRNLDPIIDSTAKHDEKFFEKIEVGANAVVAQWAKDAGRSPLKRWQDGESARVDQALALLSQLLRGTVILSNEGSDLDLIELTDRINREKTVVSATLPGLREVREVVKATVSAVGAGGAAVAGAAGVAGAGALMAIVPLSAALGVVAVWYGMRAMKRKSEQASAMRESLRTYLDNVADRRLEAIMEVCEERASAFTSAFSVAIDAQLTRIREEIAVATSQQESERPRQTVLAELTRLNKLMMDS
jgi:hypothetical protein